MSCSSRTAMGVACCAVLAASTACARVDAKDTTARAQRVDSPAARRLAGTWDATFTNDPRASITLAGATSAVTGTLAFTTDHHGPRSIDGLSGVTHEGSYDLDFQPFGWTTRPDDAPAIAVARVMPAQPVHDRTPDSLVVVLSPGTERFAVRMEGAFSADSAWGRWSARAYSAGGGAGTFVMRRHRE